MGYWDATDNYLRRHSSGPKCSRCGRTMFPQDDHGRFTCFCNLGGGLDVVSGTRFGILKTPPTDAPDVSKKSK